MKCGAVGITLTDMGRLLYRHRRIGAGLRLKVEVLCNEAVKCEEPTPKC
jgi:hypothetical protein